MADRSQILSNISNYGRALYKLKLNLSHPLVHVCLTLFLSDQIWCGFIALMVISQITNSNNTNTLDFQRRDIEGTSPVCVSFKANIDVQLRL